MRWYHTAHSELSSDFLRYQTTACRRSYHNSNFAFLIACGNISAELLSYQGMLEDAEFLPVFIAVTARTEQKMAALKHPEFLKQG
jgi:hypothetical protein